MINKVITDIEEIIEHTKLQVMKSFNHKIRLMKGDTLYEYIEHILEAKKDSMFYIITDEILSNLDHLPLSKSQCVKLRLRYT